MNRLLKSLSGRAVGAALALLQAHSAAAAAYQPEALSALIQRAEESALSGETPVVLFDLDDTLINTRERNQRILRDFAAQPGILRDYPSQAARLAGVRVSEIRYLLKDTLAGLDIHDPTFEAAANAFWLERFFSSEYCAHDLPNPGAVSYVNRLVDAGATVVYLTGRDVPRMGTGTEADLAELGFPTAAPSALLIMKSDPKQDDLAFKISQFAEVARLGRMIGLFENEPANINAMAEAFPEATAIFLDTIHSPKPDTVGDGVFWVPDFELGDEIGWEGLGSDGLVVFK